MRPLEEAAEGEEAPATPLHNHAIVEDMSFVRNLRLLHGYVSSSPQLAECAVLFRVWLRQRGLSTVTGGLNGFSVTMLLVHLIQSRKANPAMSPYQLLRVALEFLRTADFTGKGVAMACEEKPKMEAFAACFPAVFLDASGKCNIFARMSHALCMDLRHEAALSLGFLNDTSRDAFPFLFMTKLEPTAKLLRSRVRVRLTTPPPT